MVGRKCYRKLLTAAAMLLLSFTLCCFDKVAGAQADEKKPAETAFAAMTSAMYHFNHRRFKEARPYFEVALERSKFERAPSLKPMDIALANHALGHCLNYLAAGDRGERNFREANEFYEKVKEWPDVPILGMGVAGKALLDKITSGQATLRDTIPELDPSLILQTNFDWADAAYANGHYETAIEAYKKFLLGQQESRPVAYCVTAKELEGYYGRSATDQLVDSCLRLYRRSGDTAKIREAFDAIIESKLVGGYFGALDSVLREAEEQMQNGQKKQAKTLIHLAQTTLVDYLSKPDHNLYYPYEQNMAAMLEHMQSADSIGRFYETKAVPGSAEAQTAESHYWAHRYTQAADTYLDLLKKYPDIEASFAEKPNSVNGAPLRAHLAKSCVAVFEFDPKNGEKYLMQACECLTSKHVYQWDFPVLKEVQIQAIKHFYDGDFERARSLFELEEKLIALPYMEGNYQSSQAIAACYLAKIRRITQAHS